jgi:hypothetical protein
MFDQFWAQCPETNMQDKPSSSIRVLLVDDDADVRRAAALLSSRHGMALHSAATSDAAVLLLGETGFGSPPPMRATRCCSNRCITGRFRCKGGSVPFSVSRATGRD